MRLNLYSWLLTMMTAALTATEPVRATVTDTGDVALSGNDLTIGKTANGSRAVDGSADGPYDSAVLGVSQGVTGSLTLDTNATFTTTGAFTAGNQGSAVVQLNNGSTLATGNVTLGTSTFTLSGGSSWINNGAMTYNATISNGPNIAVTGGASIVTNGVSANSSYGDGLDLRVDGLGTSWSNNGALDLSGSNSSFSVLNGATAHDNGVGVDSHGFATNLLVDGVYVGHGQIRVVSPTD